MRILLITPMLGPGGLERAVQNCALEYHRRGYSVAVLAYVQGGSRVEPLRGAGVDVFLPDDGGLDGAIDRAAAWRPEVIHAHRIGAAEQHWGRFFARLSPPERRLLVIETNHFARADRSADRLGIGVHMQLSAWCLWKWSRWTRGLSPRPVGVIVPHIVRSDPFYREGDGERTAFRASLGIPADAFVFGRIGQPLLGKWSPMIFDAFDRVAGRHANAWLLLVGLPPELRPALDALPASARRRVSQVEFARTDDDLRRCYSAMDVFLHASSIGESFGYVLCESMLCGTPVVTLSRPLRDNSHPEVVGHRRGGLVVCDLRSMIQAMESMMADRPSLASMAELGRRWVLEQYSPGRVGDLLVRVLSAGREAGGDRDRLREALADLSPRRTWAQVRRHSRDCLGRPSRGTMLLLAAVANPLLYRMWVRLKFGPGPRAAA